MELFLFILLFLVVGSLAVLLYFVPFWIARYRKHPFKWPIFWLTLLLGWTGYGWAAALIWSVFPIKRDLEGTNR